MLHTRRSILGFHRSAFRLYNYKRTFTGTNSSGSGAHASTAVDSPKQGAEEIKVGSGKLLPHPPLVKNFFVGTVDKQLMPYPEVVKREDLANLHQDLKPIQDFFQSERFINAQKSSKETSSLLASDLVEEIRQLGLFGINVEKLYHGKDWGWSESFHASEPETACTELALGLLSHRVIIDLIEEVGTAVQKENFLKKLAKGYLIGTEAVFEYQAPPDGFFNTKAKYCMESKKWSISGEKAFVVSLPTNVQDANQLYLVIAETERLNLKGDAARGTTIFLVDSTLPGVMRGEDHKKFACEGLPMHYVKFHNVEVPEICVIGEAHDGNKYADLLLRSNRLRSSLIGFGLAKSLLKELTTYCITYKHSGVQLNELECIKTHLSKSTCALYAIESMLYYTAGLLDEFDKPDVLLEAAIIKYFTSKELLQLAIRSTEIIGPKSLHAESLTERAFRNIAHMYTQNETMDTLRFFIGLSGLQYAGAKVNDSVRMSRNPLFHPTHFLGKLLQNSTLEMPNTKMRLCEVLHPGLDIAALNIEHSVARLQMCVDLLFIRYGNEILERHNEIRRLAEMATTIYSMFASASRASRSYCIGLQFADHEMLLAMSVCNHGQNLVKTIATEIFDGELSNNDKNLMRLSSQIFKSKEYYPIHPLTYNF